MTRPSLRQLGSGCPSGPGALRRITNKPGMTTRTLIHHRPTMPAGEDPRSGMAAQSQGAPGGLAGFRLPDARCKARKKDGAGRACLV